MIKATVLNSITFYQVFISVALKSILGTAKFCRFEESCSSYAKRMILEKGLIKGMWLGILRLSACQPFYSPPKTSQDRRAA
ncbi:MAG: membrane protein insertion efficiency factor YidD [Candidatus Levybacteria bacterium]|nr:membrane protein insertion efficiency factor YidD [Candidatus Levybacteria bacterium]